MTPKRPRIIRHPTPFIDTIRAHLGRQFDLDRDMVDSLFALAKRRTVSLPADILLAAAKRLIPAYEDRVRATCPSSRRDWRWTIGHRKRLANEIVSVVISRERFKQLIQNRCEEIVITASFRIHVRHERALQQIANIDPRLSFSEWVSYSIATGGKISKFDRETAYRSLCKSEYMYRSLHGYLNGL